MSTDFVDIFFNLPPFHYMTKEELSAFVQATDPKIRSISSGEFTFTKTEYQSALTILYKGNFASEILAPSGRTLSVNHVEAPSVIAAPLLFLPPQKQTASYEAAMVIRAKSDSVIITIEKPDFRKALFAFPSLLDGFLALNAQRFSLLSKKVQCQAMGEIKRKTALYLLELPRLRNSVIIPMKYTELADRFAVERSSLSAVFKKLEDTGIIRRKKNREIELLNIQKLEELLY